MRKKLPPLDEKQFREDWLQLSLKELASKYNASIPTIKGWARNLGCQLPKPPTLCGEVVPSVWVKPSKDVSDNHFRARKLLAELKQVTDSDTPRMDKDAKISGLIDQILLEYIDSGSSFPELAENLTMYKKLRLAQKKVESEKESTQLDETQMRALKKKHISEAFHDMASYFNPTQLLIFKALARVATERALARRRKEAEGIQEKQIEAGFLESEAQ